MVKMRLRRSDSEIASVGQPEDELAARRHSIESRDIDDDEERSRSGATGSGKDRAEIAKI